MDKLKAEVFDLIRQQDILKIKYRRLENTKQAKLKELEAKEDVLRKGSESKTEKS